MWIYALMETQIFNFNHCVDVAMTRSVSKQRVWGQTSRREGLGYLDNASRWIRLYYKLFRRVWPWPVCGGLSGCCWQSDDRAWLEWALKMGQNFLCSDTATISWARQCSLQGGSQSSSEYVDTWSVYVCVCVGPRCVSQVWLGASQSVHITRHSSDGLEWISHTKKRHTLVPF